MFLVLMHLIDIKFIQNDLAFINNVSMEKYTNKNFSFLIWLWVSAHGFAQGANSENISHYLKLDSLTVDSVLLNAYNPFNINSTKKYYFFKTDFQSDFEFSKVSKLATNFFTIQNATDSVLNIKFNKSSLFPTSNLLKYDASYMFHYTYKIELFDNSIVVSILNLKDNNYLFYSRFDIIKEDEIDEPLEILMKKQK